jgi:2,3-dihydroxy-p-cumate/2,3-dihydroxybenzoate 3,4-dioxygenase
MTMTDGPLLTSVSYVRIAAREPLASARFTSEIFGLQQVAAENGEIAFRSDNRFRTLSFLIDEVDGASIGIEVWDEATLDQLEERLRNGGFFHRRANADECRKRRVQAAILAADASGNKIDLVARPMQSGRRYFPSRDAGVKQLHGVGLRSKDLVGDVRFWRSLGADVSDWVGDIAYLRIDAWHHRIALYPSATDGLLYAAFEVETLDNIMQSSYFMQDRQVKIVQGPGRQPASQQIFLHVEGPDGVIFSYVTGMERLAAGRRQARQFARTSDSLCAWGSESDNVPELRAAWAPEV